MAKVKQGDVHYELFQRQGTLPTVRSISSIACCKARPRCSLDNDSTDYHLFRSTVQSLPHLSANLLKQIHR